MRHERATQGTNGPALSAEQATLLDPCLDDPEQTLIYLPSGEVISPTEDGRLTIDIFGLNREELVAARAEVAQDTKQQFLGIVRSYEREEYAACSHMLMAAYDVTQPLAAVRRQFMNQRVQIRHRQLDDALRRTGQSLEEVVGGLPRVTGRGMADAAAAFFGYENQWKPQMSGHRSYTAREWSNLFSGQGRVPNEDEVGTRSVGVQRVHIRNFKGITDLQLDMSPTPGDGSWTMLLGENGVGKTSILQAIALAMTDPETIARTKMKPSAALKHGTRHGFVRVELAGMKRELSVDFERGRRFKFGSPISVPVAGYGATRLLWTSSATAPRFRTANIENLFNPFVSMSRTTLWIPELSEEQFDSVARALLRLMLIEDGDTYIDRSRQGELTLVRPHNALKISELSSGYQATAALALDLMRLFIGRWETLEAAEGVVLVDEIEAHLHPRWQMQIVEALRSAFPRVQFVATTHSPLCLRGLRNGEVAVLRRSTSDVSYLLQDLPPIEGMAIDQLLTSEHFGLNSTIDPDTEKAFDRYYELLATRERNPKEEEQLATLRGRFEDRRLFGETLRERMLLQAIDDYLALERRASSSEEHQSLKAQTREKLRAMWAGDL